MAAAKTDEMERFAFDVFVHSMSNLNTKTVIPSSKCSENTYKEPNFLDVICCETIFCQLCGRDNWFFTFEAGFKSYKFKKFQQISDFLEDELKKLDIEQRKPQMFRTILSLALLSEFIQFLYFKNLQLFLNNIARLWRRYFSPFQSKFNEEGGLPGLYLVCQEKYEPNRMFFDHFIQNSCPRYGTESIGGLMVKKLVPQFGSAVEDIQNSETEPRPIASTSRKNSSNTRRFPRRSAIRETEKCISLENPGLGITPHEELLRPTNVHFKETSDKKSASSIEGSAVSSGLVESLLSPAARSEYKGGLSRSSLVPRRRWRHQGCPSGSPISPPERRKDQGVLPRSSLSPAEQSKDQGSLTGSPLRPADGWKDRCSLTGSPINPAERLKDLGKEIFFDPGGLTRSPISPGERSKEPGSLTSSAASPHEQNQRRSSPRTPERSKDRLEQKRQKHLRRKKN